MCFDYRHLPETLPAPFGQPVRLVQPGAVPWHRVGSREVLIAGRYVMSASSQELSIRCSPGYVVSDRIRKATLGPSACPPMKSEEPR